MNRPRPQLLTTKLKRKLEGSLELVVPNGSIPRRQGQRVWLQAIDGRIEIQPRLRAATA